MIKEDECKMIEQQIEKKEEAKKIFRRCSWCENDFTWSEFWEHHDDCKSKNSISEIDIRRNQKYIKNGKMYVISDIDRVVRRHRDRDRCSQVNYIFGRLYCDEDQTSIRHAFSYDRRFRIDENKHIIIE